MDELNNILNKGEELSEEQLMNYVKGKLTEKDAHAVEREMADSSFLNDGIEGLQQFSSSEKINSYARQVNENLHQRLAEKKRKNKKGSKGLSWEIVTAIAVLLLCLLCYAIIELARK